MKKLVLVIYFVIYSVFAADIVIGQVVQRTATASVKGTNYVVFWEYKNPTLTYPLCNNQPHWGATRLVRQENGKAVGFVVKCDYSAISCPHTTNILDYIDKGLRGDKE